MKTYFPKIPLFFSIIFLLFSCLAFFYFYGAIDNSNRETKLAESEWQSQVKKRDELKKLESSFSEVEKENQATLPLCGECHHCSLSGYSGREQYWSTPQSEFLAVFSLSLLH